MLRRSRGTVGASEAIVIVTLPTYASISRPSSPSPTQPQPGCRLGAAVETFNFLGFTHICSKTQAGEFLFMRQTPCERTSRKLQEGQGGTTAATTSLSPRTRRVVAKRDTRTLCVLRGTDQWATVESVSKRGDSALAPRTSSAWPTQRSTWQRMQRLAERWIPSVRIMHPWPDTRFDVNPRQEPSAVIPLAGIRAGGGSTLNAKTRPYRDPLLALRTTSRKGKPAAANQS